MRASPPVKLVERLERLHLATPAEVASVGAHVRRLAGDLLEFDSVWIDALTQAKVLTPWQAAELHVDRGEQLVCGRYVLTERIVGPGYVACFAARHIESKQPARLYFSPRPQRAIAETMPEILELANRGKSLAGTLAVFDGGTNGQAIWCACPWHEATPLGAWLAENGRMPPAAVLQIARAMLTQLAHLAQHGIVHGDISAAGLLVDRAGDVWLPAPGLRAILRPAEGRGFVDLRPEDYDYLAPERVQIGSPPDVASDLFACGALWWHMLAGRPPRPGANAHAKLQAIQATRILDIRTLTQGVPEPLAEALASCLSTDRSCRPAGFEQVLAALGPPSPAGRELLAGLLRSPIGAWHDYRPMPTRRKSRNPAVVGAVCAAIVGLASMPLLYLRSHRAEAMASQNTVAAQVASPIAATPAAAPPAAPRKDTSVVPASATLPVEQPPDAQPLVEDLVLPAGELLRIEQLDLQSQTRVRGRGGRRPLIAVPPQGLRIAHENVVFEGIDFIWQATDRPNVASGEDFAIICLQAQTVTFRGCSFNARTDGAPAAIQVRRDDDRLPNLGAEVTLIDCVVDGMTSVVDYDASDSLTVLLKNCLCVASGPILSLARCPSESESIQLSLERVTTRGDTSVLQIRNARPFGLPGQIAIDANSSALAGTSRTGLISLNGATGDSSMLRSIVWNGHGSIITARTPFLTSRAPNRDVAELADDTIAVAGLVRGALEFAGRADGMPQESRVVHWLAPLRSPEPPGANPERLHSLRSRAVANR